MRGSILHSAIRALVVTFSVVIGLCLGFAFISFLLGAFGDTSTDSKLTTVNTEEILPNADGKRIALNQEAPVILQINIEGIIGLDGLDEASIRQQLVESREGTFKNNRVKALLLYIDTPGGTVSDADGIFRALGEYKRKYQVPIYAYVDGLCASGGMYVALAADKIFASDTSLIGSVGVLAPSFMNVSKLLDKIGVETMTLSAGKGKDAMNPLRPWKPGEEDNYRQIVDYYYHHFVDLVTTYRPAISKEELVNTYGAQVFPAPLALDKGFIDMSGVSLADALHALLKAADITGDHYQVIQLENKSWWKSLFSAESNALLTGRIEHHLSLAPEWDLLFRNQYLYLYCP